MRITKISLFHYDWICTEIEGMKISKGRSFTAEEGRVVKIETDEGLTGWGEVVPHGNIYLQAFPGAIQPGIDLFAPELIGKDPRNVEEIYHIMDNNLLGHGYIKSPIDNACWDILGKSLDKPVYELMGGMQTERPRIIAFSQRDYKKYHDKILTDLEKFRKAGCKRIQTKASGGPSYAIDYLEFISKHLRPDESMWFDCNRGWTVEQAVAVANKAKMMGVSLYFEQPCETIEQCRQVMELAGVPVIFDECILTMNDLARLGADGAIGGLSIKVGRVGGLTKAKQMRDYCYAAGITVDIQTINSSTIGDTLVAHLAHSTCPDIMGYVYCGSLLTSAALADDGAQFQEPWYLVANDKPGFGITPDEGVMKLLQAWK